MSPAEFRELVWGTTHRLYRDMPWRQEPTFYHVLVSELMLQQTQVSRVLVKYAEFMREFPTLQSLAAASLADVLRIWSGLGYNRRAKFLHDAARYVIAHDEPKTTSELVRLPGVGKNTAGAIMNYVHGVATPFVETNIRTVYFQHFFPGANSVSDAELMILVADTMDSEHPREWFWALMDYGSFLKAQGQGALDVSKHYKKQSPLRGSAREVRGQIIRVLTSHALSIKDLRTQVDADDRFKPALEALQRDGLVICKNGRYQLPNVSE